MLIRELKYKKCGKVFETLILRGEIETLVLIVILLSSAVALHQVDYDSY